MDRHKHKSIHRAFAAIGALPKDPDWFHGDFVEAADETTFTFCGACLHPVDDLGDCACALAELRQGDEGGAS